MIFKSKLGQLSLMRFVKFVLVGGSGYVVDAAIFVALSLHFSIELSSWSSSAASTLWVFALHRRVTFRGNVNSLRLSIFPFVFVLLLTTFLGQILFLALLSMSGEADAWSVALKVLSMAAMAPIRFILLGLSSFTKVPGSQG